MEKGSDLEGSGNYSKGTGSGRNRQNSKKDWETESSGIEGM